MFTENRGNLIIMALILSLVLLFSGCTSLKENTTSSNDTELSQEGEISSSNNGEMSQELPDFLTITSYDVGTVTYAQIAGICEGLLKHSNMKIRQRVSGTEFGRIIPVRSGDAHFIAGTSNTVYFANEGIGDFATID